MSAAHERLKEWLDAQSRHHTKAFTLTQVSDLERVLADADALRFALNLGGPSPDELGRSVAHARMRHYGYSSAEIERAEAETTCDCQDETRGELDKTAEFVMWVLDWLRDRAAAIREATGS